MTDNADLASMTIRDFLSATAGKTPTPGGGSVAGVVGALASALGEMALAFTRGKKSFAAHEADYAAIARRLENSRRLFLELLADDVAAYNLYDQASRAEGPDKDEKLQLALAATIDVPREMTALALAVLEDMDSLAGRCNRWLISDLAAGAILAQAVTRLSDLNVCINAGQYADKPSAAEVVRASARDVVRGEEIATRIDQAARRVIG